MEKETILQEDAFLVSETDSKGNIIFANEAFCTVAEYSLEELLGQPHNMVRHPDMPKAAFKDLWNTVQDNRVWEGYVKNKTKFGGFYWVLATVYPYTNDNGEKCYMSCRRKPSQDKVKEHIELYRTMS